MLWAIRYSGISFGGLFLEVTNPTVSRFFEIHNTSKHRTTTFQSKFLTNAETDVATRNMILKAHVHTFNINFVVIVYTFHFGGAPCFYTLSFDEFLVKALVFRPAMILCGASAYPRATWALERCMKSVKDSKALYNV